MLEKLEIVVMLNWYRSILDIEAYISYYIFFSFRIPTLQQLIGIKN